MVSKEVSNWKQQMKAVKRALMTQSKLVLLDSLYVCLVPINISEILNIITKPNTKVRISILLVEQNTKLTLSVASCFSRIIHDDEPGFHYICIGGHAQGQLGI
jgi:ABC-type branched-subunit amino acid transport system ATPase component